MGKSQALGSDFLAVANMGKAEFKCPNACAQPTFRAASTRRNNRNSQATCEEIYADYRQIKGLTLVFGSKNRSRYR